MQMLQQVLKHFKTLLKYLHDQVKTTKDPTVIEQTNRQIRSIEKLSNEVKTSMKSQMKRAPKDQQESFFTLSASESVGEGGQQRLSADSGVPRPSIAAGRKNKKLALVARESMHACADNIAVQVD